MREKAKAEAEALRALARVEAIHVPIRVYDECEHDADHGCEPVEVYDYMASYSPYENVGGTYPPILATTSLNDTRVLYVEPAKWIARLKEVADGGPFLFKCEMSAGHGGVSGRYAKWKETAFEYAWLLKQAGAADK